MTMKHKLAQAQSAHDKGRTVIIEEAYPSNEFVRITYAFGKHNVAGSKSLFDLVDRSEEEGLFEALAKIHEQRDRQAVTVEVAYLPYAGGVREYTGGERNPYVRSLAVGCGPANHTGELVEQFAKMYGRPVANMVHVKEDVAAEADAVLKGRSKYSPDEAPFTGVACVRVWTLNRKGGWNSFDIENDDYKPVYSSSVRSSGSGTTCRNSLAASSGSLTVSNYKEMITWKVLVGAFADAEVDSFDEMDYSDKGALESSICWEIIRNSETIKINPILRSAARSFICDDSNKSRLRAAAAYVLRLKTP